MLNACWLLMTVSLRRMIRTRQTVISGLLLVCAALAVVAWSLRHQRTPQQFVHDMLLPVYVSFLLPMLCLCYATPSIAGEREERTLVYLLATPLPRPLIYAAKFAAVLLVTLAWTFGTFATLSWLAGTVGRNLFRAFCPAVFWSTAAYVGLFHLLSATLRRATIVGLVYALFLEALLGNMPGIIKRVAISFYTQCLILDAGRGLGVEPTAIRDPRLLVPVSGSTAWQVLCALTVVLFAIGTWVFSRREYESAESP
jgi:ABC-type transport system involved in multi-copper enzyme maturation permease subunit